MALPDRNDGCKPGHVGLIPRGPNRSDVMPSRRFGVLVGSLKTLEGLLIAGQPLPLITQPTVFRKVIRKRARCSKNVFNTFEPEVKPRRPSDEPPFQAAGPAQHARHEVEEVPLPPHLRRCELHALHRAKLRRMQRLRSLLRRGNGRLAARAQPAPRGGGLSKLQRLPSLPSFGRRHASRGAVPAGLAGG